MEEEEGDNEEEQPHDVVSDDVVSDVVSDDATKTTEGADGDAQHEQAVEDQHDAETNAVATGPKYLPCNSNAAISLPSEPLTAICKVSPCL